MKKLVTFLILVFLVSVISYGQIAYVPTYAGGQLTRTDLTNANQTNLGATQTALGAGDFGPDNILYGIKFTGTDIADLYSIDTTDGTTTHIGAINPPTNHIWTGMAFDYSTATMYGLSSYGIAAGECSLHIIDVTDATYATVGTQGDATAIGCIAIDDDGQMYGMNLSASADIYLIDKTDGSVTYLGEANTMAAGMGHGMDYCSENQTMYLITYHSGNMTNSLRTVDLETGNTTAVGPTNEWCGFLACDPFLEANFSADQTTVCAGGTVNFNDQSAGQNSWEWEFEGGDPATSTEQNPAVTYNTPGIYDVELTVSNGTEFDTELKVDYITVIDIPEQATAPTGDDEVCTGGIYNYNTDEVAGAEEYEWELSPPEAGTVTGSTTQASFEVAEDWTGDFTIKVRATNMCGDGDWSDEFAGTVYLSPEVFTLEGGGGYCVDGDGVEITLSSSQSDIEYELYLDDEPTGNNVSGTGSEISFGLVTDLGIYTAYGSSDYCLTLMQEQIEVFNLFPPLEPGTPTGPEAVCNNETSEYTSTGSDDADSYEWILSPEEAGTLTAVELDATVEWSTDFSGTAYISLYGINDCGEGYPSSELEVMVDAIPTPEVTGPDEVCDFDVTDYSTLEAVGNTYNWEVTGGTITDGQGTYMVTVEWGEPGSGTVTVTEESGAGCTGASETFEVFIDDCTAIGENGLEQQLSVYPNPATDKVNIESKSKLISITIFTLSGEMMNEITVNDFNYKLNTSEFKSGIYLLRLKTDKGSVSKRLVIE